MNEKTKIKLAQLAGLIPAGKDEDGEQEFLGSEQDWNKFEELMDEEEGANQSDAHQQEKDW